MSDPTTALGFEMQAQSTPAWWDNLNDALQAIDSAIAGSLTISTTGGDSTLTVNPYVADQSRLSNIRITGALSSAVRVIANRKREYSVSNETSSGAFAVSFGYDAANQVTIPRGYWCRILNKDDGTSIRTTALIAVADGKVYTGDIPAVTSAMLDSALQTTITNASSNASTAITTANAAAAQAAAALAATAVAASDSVAGIVELATSAETTTGTDTVRAVTPAGLAVALGQVPGIDTQTASYTLVLGDKGQVVEINNASANTLTVPPNSSVAFPIKSYINVVQMGAGQTTITAGVGVTLFNKNGLKLSGQYAMATLYKRATDEWVVGGDLTT